MQLNHLSPNSYQPSATMETLRSLCLTFLVFGSPIVLVGLVEYSVDKFAEARQEQKAAEKAANPSPLQLRQNYGL